MQAMCCKHTVEDNGRVSYTPWIKDECLALRTLNLTRDVNVYNITQLSIMLKFLCPLN